MHTNVQRSVAVGGPSERMTVGSGWPMWENPRHSSPKEGFNREPFVMATKE